MSEKIPIIDANNVFPEYTLLEAIRYLNKVKEFWNTTSEYTFSMFSSENWRIRLEIVKTKNLDLHQTLILDYFNR